MLSSKASSWHFQICYGLAVSAGLVSELPASALAGGALGASVLAGVSAGGVPLAGSSSAVLPLAASGDFVALGSRPPSVVLPAGVIAPRSLALNPPVALYWFNTLS